MTYDIKAFSAIELVIVLGIMLAFSTIAVVGIGKAMRTSQLNSAEEAIRDMANRARSLSMSRSGDAANSRIGIRITTDEKANGQVEIIKRSNGNKIVPFTELRRKIPPSVQIWNAATPLTSGEVVWYYDNMSGFTITPSMTGYEVSSVGCTPPKFKDGTRYVSYGAQLTSTKPLPLIAPSSNNTPGLSLRTRDNQLRRALSIYVSGIFASANF